MPLVSRFLAVSLAILALVTAAQPGGRPARAAATPWLDHDHAQVRLLAESDSVGGGESVYLGLQFDLAPGWKIYWRDPGDAGFPPALDWQGSSNLASAELQWPVPRRFTLFDLQTFGYGGAVVLPILARLERAGEAVSLRAQLSYLVCSEICVPHDGQFAMDLPAGPMTSSPEVFLVQEARALVPGEGAEEGLSLESALLSGTTESPLLKVVARSDIPFQSPDVLVEGPPGFLFDAPQVALSEGGRRAELTVTTGRSAVAKGVLEGKQLTLTVTDGQRGLESAVILRHDVMPASGQAAGGLSLLAVLGLALLGGLILNLMPCVLPVLSIKLLSVVSHGGRDRGAVRVSFLASAAGIVFSFLVLAGVAVALKAAGMAAGWGIQFQQPLFLSAMALVVTLFALNLLGLFEIPLPAWLGDLATAGGQGEAHGLAGHFATGAFATLLATPCTAPFLGTAVGFALAGGALDILLVFATLGLGLALPYLLVAALPGLATRLPRPGRWMVVLRRILGLFLAGTAVWLLSVLAGQVGGTAALLVGALLVALGLIFLLGRGWRGTARAGAVAALALAAFVVPAGFAATVAPPSTADDTGQWRAFDQAEIDRLIADGKVVFVDVTADWCITCLYNKTGVMEQGEVAARLGNGAVVTMRRDWTRPSDEIAAYLAGFGRYGIPFNAVYGPGAPQGAPLPEILTSDSVLEALDQAAGG